MLLGGLHMCVSDVRAELSGIAAPSVLSCRSRWRNFFPQHAEMPAELPSLARVLAAEVMYVDTNQLRSKTPGKMWTHFRFGMEGALACCTWLELL